MHRDQNIIFNPALEASSTCFAPVRQAQTELEACYHPTTMKIIPMVEDLKNNLTLLSTSVATGPILEHVHELTKVLARETLLYLKLIHQDLWCAACVMHPGFTASIFVPSE